MRQSLFRSVFCILLLFSLTACYDMPISNPLATSTAYGPDGTSRAGEIEVAGYRPGYVVQRDDENGALVYLYPNGSGQVLPYTQTPVPASTRTPTPTYTPTHTPTYTPTYTPTHTPTHTPTYTPTYTPTSSPTLTPPNLVNGGMEDGTVGWTKFVAWQSANAGLEINSERLSTGASPFAVHEGDASLRVLGRYHCWVGGVYQQVSVEPGRSYEFGMWAMVWANASSNFNLAHDQNVYTSLSIGLDPEGDTDPNSTGIRWTTREGTDDFRLQRVRATAIGRTMTVFLRANLGAVPGGGCQWPLYTMMALFDAVSVSVVGSR